MSRQAKASGQVEEPSKQDLECKRLTQLAFEKGVLAKTQRATSNVLPPSKAMLKADGKDIVKKSSTRRNRYLFVFNCQLAPAAAGRMGTLSQLDSKTPVMYIDFPEGRMKLFGTLVFPRNKYMVLRLTAKHALCEDVLESMVVFSEAWWVGSAEENPEERRLPMPDALRTERRHTTFEFSSRPDGQEAEATAEEAPEEDKPDPASQPASRRATRAAGGKRARYNDDLVSSSDDDQERGGAHDQEPPLRRLPKLPKQEAPDPAAQATSLRVQGTLHDFLGRSSSAEDMTQPEAAPQPAARRASLPPKATPKTGQRSKAVKAGSTKLPTQQQLESQDDEDEGDDEGGEAAGQSPASAAGSRPRRAAANEASRRLVLERSDGEDSGGGLEGGDSSGSEGEAASTGSGGAGSVRSGSESDYQPSASE